MEIENLGAARQVDDVFNRGRHHIHLLATDQVEGLADDTIELILDRRCLLRCSRASPDGGGGAESDEESGPVPGILEVAIGIDVTVVQPLRSFDQVD